VSAQILSGFWRWFVAVRVAVAGAGETNERRRDTRGFGALPNRRGIRIRDAA